MEVEWRIGAEQGRHVAVGRALRDRWPERVNADPSVLSSQGKYDVTRTIAHADGGAQTPPSLLHLINPLSLAA